MGENNIIVNRRSIISITMYKKIILFSIVIFLSGVHVYVRLCGAEVVDRVVAVVNEDVVSLSELTGAVQPYADKIKSLGYSLEKEREMLFKVREDILDQIIKQKLTYQESKKYKLSVSEKELDNSIERFKEANHYTDEDLRSALAKDNISMEEYRDKVKDNILRTKLLNIEVKSKIVITRDDIKSYYENHKNMYQSEKRYHLQNMVKKADYSLGADDKKAILLIMEEIYNRLKEGKPFDQVSRDYSGGSYDIKSLDLGTFKPDQLSQQVRDAIKGLNSGECTKVFETEIGYQIIYIQDIEEKPGKSLDEAAPEIEDILFREILDKKFLSWIDALKQKSHIKIIK
ncbi:MAG: SurA N-terminal domain-containing protein [Proteobacteria bacterium]|nr:SurA N-terminal domain-containing protein [Pseudomonadota bacterium]